MGRKKAKPQDSMKLAINGVLLEGVKLGGVWAWTCSAYPDLVAKYDGKTDSAGMIGEFTKRALAGSVKVLFSAMSVMSE